MGSPAMVRAEDEGNALHRDYDMTRRKLKKANHLSVYARQKLPLGSTQPPATQVTHARRGSAQFRSFIFFFFI